MWGTTRPTKPMLPAIVTAVAVSRLASMYINHSSGRTEIPNAAACIGPRANTFRLRPSGTTRTQTTVNNPSPGHGIQTYETSPISQYSMPGNSRAGLIANIRVITAPQPAATTTPVSNRREGVQLPVPWASPNTIKVASRAPAKAEPEITAPPSPASIASNAPTAAPPDRFRT